MERHLTWTVDKSQEGKRLIDWLREKGCSKQGSVCDKES